VTRRLRLDWPDPAPFKRRDGRPIRILAISDDPDHALDDARNRDPLGQVDLVVGCGDLSPDWLSFVADAFLAPLVYVRGNHDDRGPWPEPKGVPVAASGVDRKTLPGLPILALSWPRFTRDGARHDERSAWRQVASLGRHAIRSPRPPMLVVSHVPPRDAGDTPTDPYHRGYSAYRFLADRVRPPLWLHGHTNLAAQTSWLDRCGPTTLVNATGSVLVEIAPPGSGTGDDGEVSSSGR
jgi:calcineurin-like phosphoesterase family protein